MNTGTKISIMAVVALIGLISVGAMLPLTATDDNIAGLPQITEPSLSPPQDSIKVHGHVDVYVKKTGADSFVLVSSEDNLFVTAGRNYWKGAAANSSKYFSLSNDTGAPAANWVNIPAEITTNGLERALGTYADNGTGAWNFTKTWTATGAQSARLVGLNYANVANDGTLTNAAQVASAELQVNDQLQVIYSVSVT